MIKVPLMRVLVANFPLVIEGHPPSSGRLGCLQHNSCVLAFSEKDVSCFPAILSLKPIQLVIITLQ